ncbi:MAG TPA: MFS transporter, partial [Candidatus Eisenbacteria bacterium]|nr:MFS transporter [Candidatus Eisenbacteria bacterium]
QVTHSSFWVGLGLFLTQGPVVVMAPFSGAVADRFDRRTLNVASSAASAVTTGLFGLLSWLGLTSLPVVLTLSLLFGLSFVFQMTLRSTLVPSLVPPARILNAVSLFQVGTQGAQFLGPALATPILASKGPATAWGLCALLYATSALLAVGVGESRVRAGEGLAGRPLAGSLRYLRVRPLAWTATCAVALHCSLTMAYQGMLPMFVATDLRAGTSSYGALLISIGVGAVAGSLALARLADRSHRPALFAVSLVGSGLSLSVLGAAPNVAVALVAGFSAGATQAMFMSMTLALIQSSVENEYRGRATSIFQMIALTPMAVFGWGMGGLADVTEPRPLMVASGAAFLLAMALYAGRSTWLRGLFRPEGWQPAAEPVPVVEAAPLA